MQKTAAKKTAAKKTTRPRVSAAERKRREAQAAEAAGQVEIPLENGVVVWRVENPQRPGDYSFVVQTIGDVKPTEISDTLAYGHKVNREQRGLTL